MPIAKLLPTGSAVHGGGARQAGGTPTPAYGRAIMTLARVRMRARGAKKATGCARVSFAGLYLVCLISLIAEGQAANSLTGLCIVANRSMPYFTERLINNTCVQVNVFLSVDDIPIDQIGSDGNRSVIVIDYAAPGKNNDGYSGSHILYAGNREAVVFKRLFFGVNFVIGSIDSNTVGVASY